jgi:hypothetical protein
LGLPVRRADGKVQPFKAGQERATTPSSFGPETLSNQCGCKSGELVNVKVKQVLERLVVSRAVLATGILLVSPAFLAQSVFAQQGQLLIDASPCLVFETSVERLVCFEEQVKVAENARQGSAATSASSNLPVLTIQRSNAGAAPAAVTPPRAPAPAQAAPAVAQPVPAGQASVQPAQTSEDNFGIQQRSEKIDQPRVELTSKIASVRQLQRGLWLVTLENGQVWRQMTTKSYALVPGQSVRIYPSGWGKSFRLSVKELGSFIQVERVE